MKIKSQISNVKIVRSEERKALNKNLVAFHKSFKLVFNATVIAHTHVKRGMFANIYHDPNERKIYVNFTDEKHYISDRKVGDPMFSKVSEYLYVRTTQLLWDYNTLLLGAFEYSWNAERKQMIIYY